MKFEEIGWEVELKNSPLWIRIFIALLTSSVLAYYLPMIIVSLTGHWANNLTDPRLLLVSIGIYIFQNSVGILFRRITLVGIAFAVAWFLFFLVTIVLTRRIEGWKEWWPVLFAPELASLINAFCLAKLGSVLDIKFIKMR